MNQNKIKKHSTPIEFKAKKNISQNRKSNILFSGFLFVLILSLIVLLIDIFGLYYFNWQDRFSYQVAKILSLPAGTVDGQEIKLSDYLITLKITNLTSIENSQKEKTAKLSIFNTVVVDKLVSNELHKYNQSVSNQEIENEWQKESIIDNPAKKTNLSIKDFKNEVIKSDLAKQKLQKIIVNDESLSINQAARKKAEDILALASVPKINFNDLAGQYTEDATGVLTGGNMGWIAKGELSPEFDQIFFNAPTGKVYDKLIKSRLGYSIIKVEQRLVDNSSGKESVEVSQILIKIDLNQYIKELADKSVIKNFINRG